MFILMKRIVVHGVGGSSELSQRNRDTLWTSSETHAGRINRNKRRKMSNFGHDSLRKIQEAQKNWERGPCLCFSKIIILPCKNASPTYWQERENVFQVALKSWSILSGSMMLLFLFNWLIRRSTVYFGAMFNQKYSLRPLKWRFIQIISLFHKYLDSYEYFLLWLKTWSDRKISRLYSAS